MQSDQSQSTAVASALAASSRVGSSHALVCVCTDGLWCMCLGGGLALKRHIMVNNVYTCFVGIVSVEIYSVVCVD